MLVFPLSYLPFVIEHLGCRVKRELDYAPQDVIYVSHAASEILTLITIIPHDMKTSSGSALLYFKKKEGRLEGGQRRKEDDQRCSVEEF